MSLGIAVKGHSIVGNIRQTIATVNFGTSYPTGGEPLSARNLALGLKSIGIQSIEAPGFSRGE